MIQILFISLITIAIAIAANIIFGRKYSQHISIAAVLLVLIYMSYSISAFTSGSLAVSESLPYISSLGISLHFTLTPISIMLITMSLIVTLAAIVWQGIRGANTRSINSLLLLFLLSAIGLFASANLFLFYIFWDVGVISVFFIIRSFGSASRDVASKNFLIYSIFASALLLFAIMLIYFYTPVGSFNISYITAHSYEIPIDIQESIFMLMFIAFAIKMPVFPFHSWMPNAYSDAPTSGSVVIAGVLSKFGAYGMLVLFYLLPVAETLKTYVYAIAVVSVFYSAFAAMRQNDLKKMAGYTSMIESGIILAGIASLNYLGEYGSVYMMLAHGFTIALMFIAIGSLEFAYGTRSISILKGAVSSAKSASYSFMLAIFGSTGMPLTAGFIAELMIFIGTVSAFGLYGIVPLAGIILLGAYMYLAVSRSIMSTKEKLSEVGIIGKSQKAAMAIAIAAVLFFGVFPFIFLNMVKI